MLLLLGAVAFYGLWQLGQQVREERQRQARVMVQLVINQITHIHALEIIGSISHQKARQEALDLVEATRFVDGSYIWVHDLQGRILAHPTQPNLVSASRNGTLNPEVKDLFSRFNQQVSATGSAFVPYQWAKPGETTPSPKISYMQVMEPWGWVIGSGVYIDDVELAQWRRGGVILTFSLLVSVAGIGVLTHLFFSITRPLRHVQNRLNDLARGQVPEGFPTQNHWGDVGFAGAAVQLICERMQSMRRRGIEAEKELLRMSVALDSLREGVIITDPRARILKVNRAFTQLTGYTVEEAVGQTPAILSSGRHERDFYETLWATLRETGHWSGEIWNRGKNGRVYPEVLTINAIFDAHQTLIGYAGAFSDVTEGKRQAEKIQWYADHDVLTGLVNRRALEQQGPLLLRSALSRGQIGAVLLVDIDGFKSTNDTHGHVAGDRVLQTFARRLKENTGDDVLLSRMGGDEFICIIAPLESRDDARMIGKRLLSALSAPIIFDGISLSHSVSIGLVIAPDQATQLDEALRLADVALQKAKDLGRGRLVDAKALTSGSDYSI
jgi:diguanylate cyclase (GGDEF)-like protein/PAS domain S-box-containing protein